MLPKRNPVTPAEGGARPSLPELCTEAANHVASARLSLGDPAYDADQALAHLDEAIFCLKRLLEHGSGARKSGSQTVARSA